MVCSKCDLSLRIRGDELIPKDISELLGVSPSYSHAKGDEFSNPGSMDPKAPSGIWILSVPDDSLKNVSNQIDGLLSRLTDDLETWKQLNTRFSTSLSALLYIQNDDRMNLSKDVVCKISDRGLGIGFRYMSPPLSSAENV